MLFFSYCVLWIFCSSYILSMVTSTKWYAIKLNYKHTYCAFISLICSFTTMLGFRTHAGKHLQRDKKKLHIKNKDDVEILDECHKTGLTIQFFVLLCFCCFISWNSRTEYYLVRNAGINQMTRTSNTHEMKIKGK